MSAVLRWRVASTVIIQAPIIKWDMGEPNLAFCFPFQLLFISKSSFYSMTTFSFIIFISISSNRGEREAGVHVHVYSCDGRHRSMLCVFFNHSLPFLINFILFHGDCFVYMYVCADIFPDLVLSVWLLLCRFPMRK